MNHFFNILFDFPFSTVLLNTFKDRNKKNQEKNQGYL